MRQSQLLIPTLREDPGEAEIVSHRLMLRAGMIRKVAAGIYTYLPLGLRVIRKVERIIREELNSTGPQEVLMPIASPAQLRKATGRCTRRTRPSSPAADSPFAQWRPTPV